MKILTISMFSSIILLILFFCSFVSAKTINKSHQQGTVTQISKAPHSLLYYEPLQHWLITQHKSGFSYNTSTQEMMSKDYHDQGLISVAKRGGYLLKSYWQEGAHRSTISFNDNVIVDGYDINDVSRISSFRFDKKGNYAFIHSTKGPKSKVKLIYNDKTIFSWPRLSKVKILKFDNDQFIISEYLEKKTKTMFTLYQLDKNLKVLAKKSSLGSVKRCSILSAKVQDDGILLQNYCFAKQGSDINFLSFSNKKVHTISATENDEIFAFYLVKGAKKLPGYPVLTISGSNNALQLFNAISASLLSLLGEPMSMASDEAGKQSWSQSYRTLALAELYNKTKHSVFAALAHQAMQSTLKQQNQFMKIKGQHNPGCAWASRIYSNDGKTPISFLINQAMIANSLSQSCNKIGRYCSSQLQKKIQQNSLCLVNEYEYLFDNNSGLYQIPYASNFRYDGLYAPWNWQLTWAAVLNSVAEHSDDAQLADRANTVIEKFLSTWEYSSDDNTRALWRYWTPRYYHGWKPSDKRSTHRPKQKAVVLSKQRYEDLNHAGISLLGMHFSGYSLSQEKQHALQNTISNLLSNGAILPRDMNGDGPKNPRWSLGAGWHAYATTHLSQLFTHKLPSAASSNKHLAYAMLADMSTPFNLHLTLATCPKIVISQPCKVYKKWHWSDINNFISNNPFFSLKVIAHDKSEVFKPAGKSSMLHLK